MRSLVPTPRETPGQPSAAGLLRLNKAIAQAGVCSRRAADELILSGRIAVNGQVVTTPGVRIDPLADVVSLDGRVVCSGALSRPVVVLLHKPPMVVTTVKDPQQRQTVLDLLPQEFKKMRLFPVGRLDYFSEGLILLTNEGELAYRLTHPKWHMPKIYRVLVRGEPEAQTLEHMRQGMTLLEGDRVEPIDATADKAVSGTTWLTLHLTQGLNRQIRRQCRDLGLTILRLIRVRQGPIELASLARGAFRELTAPEIADLRAAVGLLEQAESMQPPCSNGTQPAKT